MSCDIGSEMTETGHEQTGMREEIEQAVEHGTVARDSWQFGLEYIMWVEMLIEE